MAAGKPVSGTTSQVTAKPLTKQVQYYYYDTFRNAAPCVIIIVFQEKQIIIEVERGIMKKFIPWTLTIAFLVWTIPVFLSCQKKTETSGDAESDEDGATDEEDIEEETDDTINDSEDIPDDNDSAGDVIDVIDVMEDDTPDSSDAADLDEEEEYRLTVSECFADKSNPDLPGPDYDRFFPVIGSHCLGTNHQNIDYIEKVVFLGDSITVGTPPTMFWDYYRSILTQMLRDRFGPVESGSCAAWGARTDDLLLPPHQQILECFPEPEPKRTLVVMTVGGNDFNAMAQDWVEGKTMPEIMAMAEETVQYLREAVEWFFEEPSRFPNGVFVLFSNIYEFTDATGDLNSCFVAQFAGLGGSWPEGREPAIYLNEEYMRIAVDTQTDMIFMLEHFCGHGFHNDDPESQCYMGPGAERWFDLTCIHPNPTGHAVIADMFMALVNE